MTLSHLIAWFADCDPWARRARNEKRFVELFYSGTREDRPRRKAGREAAT